jgi:hypothetical protein
MDTDEQRQLRKEAERLYRIAVDAELAAQEEHWRRIKRFRQRLADDGRKLDETEARVLEGRRDEN